MKRSCVYVLASAAILLAFRLASALISTVVRIARRTRGWARSLLVPRAGRADQMALQARPLVALRRARAFVLGQLQRTRPKVTPGWRLCPSV